MLIRQLLAIAREPVPTGGQAAAAQVNFFLSDGDEVAEPAIGSPGGGVSIPVDALAALLQAVYAAGEGADL